MERIYTRLWITVSLLLLLAVTGCRDEPKKAARKVVREYEACWSNVSPEIIRNSLVTASGLERLQECTRELNENLLSIAGSFDQAERLEFENEMRSLALRSDYREMFIAVGLARADSNLPSGAHEGHHSNSSVSPYD